MPVLCTLPTLETLKGSRPTLSDELLELSRKKNTKRTQTFFVEVR